MPDQITTLQDVKKYLNITDAYDDVELQTAIDTAVAVVQSYVGDLVSRTVTETYDAPAGHGLPLLSGPVVSVTSVTESGVTLDSGDYKIGLGGVLHRMSGSSYAGWLPGALNITVEYTVGMTTIPSNLITAVKELVRVNWRNQRGGNYSPFDGDVADNYAATGDQVRLGFFVPGRVMELIAPNPRIAGLA